MIESQQAHADQAESAEALPLPLTHPHTDHPYNKLKDCDIVMKGGITSGVVYPDAVYELAQHYRLHSIGGTSAGAIAAAAAAAAELGRYETGTEASFDRLKELPCRLGEENSVTKKSTLFGFFQPQPKTAPLFDTAVAFLGDDAGRVQRVLIAALRSFPFAAVVGTIPALFMLLFTFAPKNWGMGIVEFLLIVFWALVGCALAVICEFVWRTFTGLRDNYFGFCTGMSSPRRNWFMTLRARLAKVFDKIADRQGMSETMANQPVQSALTEWLADFLDELAGITNRSKPLTFGDLRWGLGKQNPKGDESYMPDYKEFPAIGLRMITTNLTLGRPYSLPFETDIFLFDPEEWGKFFPPRIVEWLVEHVTQIERSEKGKRRRIYQNSAGRVLLPLPVGDDLPVVVATRMSLSFPILLCAVPMYLVDFKRKINRTPGIDMENGEEIREEAQEVADTEIAKANASENREDNAQENRMDRNRCDRFFAERCWFSDGGIAINFPVHFFDRPLPRWPTFAINLSVPHPDYPLSEMTEEEKVWMPTNNREGALPTWTRWSEEEIHAPLFGFLGAILYTARTWMDQTQMTAPGYRDRIVHIAMDQKEGGLNLKMRQETIKLLAGRGRLAGMKVVQNYAHPSTSPDHVITWDNHRWIRYRSSMTMLEELFAAIDVGYSSKFKGFRSYEELIRRDPGSVPKGYPLASKAQRKLATDSTKSLITLVNGWKANQEKLGVKLEEGTPKPKSEIQSRTRI